MTGIVRIIDWFTAFIGKSAAWLTLFMVLITAVQVLLRYIFNQYSIAAQELVEYMHAAVFLLGAAWALQTDGHVRVDIFYRSFSVRKKAIVNIIGTIVLLLPFFILMTYLSWGYMLQSWKVREGGINGGLPYIYLLKTLMPVFTSLMILQGVAEIFRNILILRGKIVPPAAEV